MYLENAKTIVIKIGSSLLIDDNKKIKTKWLKEFVKDVQKLLNEKKKYYFGQFWCYCSRL